MNIFTPLHQKFVNDCYISEELYPEKSSLLIHHIHVKFGRIIKITRYMKEACKKEIRKTGNCVVTMRLLTEIFNTFSGKSSAFEKNIFRILISVFNHLQKEYSLYLKTQKKRHIKSEGMNLSIRYKTYLDFLELFYSSEIKTYYSNGYIKIMLENISYILSTKHDKFAVNEVKAEESYVFDSMSEESTSIKYYKGFENNEKNEEYDLLFLDILEKILFVKDLFHNFYREKILWFLTSLMNLNLNYKKRTELMSKFIREKTNIVNVRSFISCYLHLNTIEDIHVGNIDPLMLNLKDNFLSLVLIQINLRLLNSKDILGKMFSIEKELNDSVNVNYSFEKIKRLEFYNTGEFINQTENYVVQKTISDTEFKIFGKNIFAEDPLSSLYNDKEYKIVFILIQWSFSVISNKIFLKLNTIEIVQSYLNLLSAVYELYMKKEEKNPEFSFSPINPQRIEKNFKNYSSDHGIPKILLVNLRTYLVNCNLISDAFYYILKSIFKDEITSVPQEHETNKEYKYVRDNKYSFNCLILEEIEKHAKHYEIFPDDKLLALLIEIKERTSQFDQNINRIISNIVSTNNLKIPDVHGIFCKFRSDYYRTMNNEILPILKIIFKRYKNIRDLEGTQTLNLLFKIQSEKIFMHEDNSNNINIDNFAKESDLLGKIYDDAINSNHYDFRYDPNDDDALYEKMLSTNKKVYTQSVKSTLNLDSLVSKRKSKIRNIFGISSSIEKQSKN